MILIIGLGNPGEKYSKTRHNVAWIIFDFLNKNFDWQKNKYAKALITSTSILNEDIVLVKPETFMNESGKVLDFFEKEYSITNENLIVIHDDIDLPLGKVRISNDRGDGGHNGVKSMVQHLGSKNFTRIRIGVSILDNDQVLHKPDVLSSFSKDDLEKIETEITPQIAGIIKSLIEKGLEVTMNKFN